MIPQQKKQDAKAHSSRNPDIKDKKSSRNTGVKENSPKPLKQPKQGAVKTFLSKITPWS